MKLPHLPVLRNVFLSAAVSLSGLTAFAANDWPSAAPHNFAPTLPEGVELTDTVNHIRPAWEVEIHTGIGKSGSGTAMGVLEEGFEPTFGDTSAGIMVDGLYILSWAEATGDVSGDPDKVDSRYFSNEERNETLADTYLRIDANWNTIALDLETGEERWRTSEPSASLNFVSDKRSHNGINPAAGEGVFVTVSVTGHVFGYDVATGERRWHTTIPEWNDRAEDFKAEALEERRIPSLDDDIFGSKRAGVVVVDGVAVVPDLMGGVLGLSLSDGSLLWQEEDRLHDGAIPRIWENGGESYLLTNNADGRGNREVHLMNPRTGETVWSHETGQNPGQLIMGDGVLVMNPEGQTNRGASLAAYEISLEGLNEIWRHDEDQKMNFRHSHRHSVIADGVLYSHIGDRVLVSYDLRTGEELYRDEGNIHRLASLPVIKGDKLYLQIDPAHTNVSGIHVFQLEDNGAFSYLGDVTYNSLGIDDLIDYENPIEIPYGSGLMVRRGKTNIVGIDLRVVQNRIAEASLHGAWPGFHRPIPMLLFGDAEGDVISARLEVPPRYELGVVGTTGRRMDGWFPVEGAETMKLGEAIETQVNFDMISFSWDAEVVMEEAEGDTWKGTWSREFPGWEETLTLSGELHSGSEGGYNRRGWPTGWLEDQPVTFFSELEEGQERVFLQVHGALPREDGERRNVTLCLDHDGEKVVSAVGGGFSFNQSYHEIDASGLEVTSEGITGTAYVILNGDPWNRDTDWKNGGSLLGKLTLDVSFREPNQDGIYPVRGDWEIEWGLADVRTGTIEATLLGK